MYLRCFNETHRSVDAVAFFAILRRMNTENATLTSDSPAEKCIRAFGGVRTLARLLGRNASSISRWRKPQELGGTGGKVPSALQGRILMLAKAHGVSLVAEDLIFMGDE
jgi:hypothetical protein